MTETEARDLPNEAWREMLSFPRGCAVKGPALPSPSPSPPLADNGGDVAQGFLYSSRKPRLEALGGWLGRHLGNPLERPDKRTPFGRQWGKDIGAASIAANGVGDGGGGDNGGRIETGVWLFCLPFRPTSTTRHASSVAGADVASSSSERSALWKGGAPPAQLRKMTCPERRPGWAPSNPPLPVPLGFGGRKLVIGGEPSGGGKKAGQLCRGGWTYIYFVAIPERMYQLQDCWKYPEMYQMYQMYQMYRSF